MTRYRFTCTDCGEQIEVDGAVRWSILEHGCPVCTAATDTACFEPAGRR